MGVQRKLGKEEMQAMAERLTRKEAKEKKELKTHPMQLKYEYDAKSRMYTEKYIRAKKVSDAYPVCFNFCGRNLICCVFLPA